MHGTLINVECCLQSPFDRKGNKFVSALSYVSLTISLNEDLSATEPVFSCPPTSPTCTTTSVTVTAHAAHAADAAGAVNAVAMSTTTPIVAAATNTWWLYHLHATTTDSIITTR